MYNLDRTYQQARDMTLWELNRCVEAYRDEEYQKWNLMRIQTAYILQQNTKKRVDPRKLVPLEGDDDTLKSDSESFKQDLAFFRRKVKNKKVIN